MNPTVIEVATERGTMPVHLHRPDGDASTPLVVLYMDGPGLRPAVHGHAERLTRAGYTVAIPDLYYAFDPADKPDLDKLAAGEGSEFGRMGALVARVNDAEVLADTRLMLGLLPGSDEPWGIVGFCMGGRFGLRAAEAFGEQVAAAALMHPSKLVTDEPDSPHLTAGSVSASLYLGFGQNDHVTPLSTIPPLREQLEQHGVAHQIDVIADADHGFTMPGLPAYNPAAAEQALDGTLAVLGEGLSS